MEAHALLLLLVLPATIGGPVSFRYQDDSSFGYDNQNTECSTHCTGSNKFQYDIGKTYLYQYEVNTVTSMHGASNDVARIDVKATASIQVLSKCELALSLSDVTMSKSNPDQRGTEEINDWTFKSALERNPLRFSFQDGRIEDLCPSNSEETMSLNFKRGVLSAFQNSMNQHERDESLKEVDVTGSCPTTYSVAQKGWKSSHFSKTKDLLGCSDRHDYRTTLQSTPYHFPDAIQSLPLLKGNHKCTQMVSSEGHMQSSTCVESLVFRPFSKQEAGARTETTQKLTHLYSKAGSYFHKEAPSTRTTLLFEHKKTMRSSDETMWAANDKLTNLCQITVQDIPAEVPGMFTDLVYLMRGLDSQQLKEMGDRVHRNGICVDNKEKAKKFYLDALPMVGTSASTEVMVDMLLSGEITDAEADLWTSSLHFVQHPTIEMVGQLKRLLLAEAHRMKALLPVTSLVNNFCHGQSSCLTIREVGDIVDVLDDILGKDCQSTEEDLILMTLRAAGNLGYSDQLAMTLDRCAKFSGNPMYTRVLAVQAFRGVTCDADRTALMDIFKNKGEDSELRIAAYLGVMKCWNENVLSEVKQTLEMEAVNQVGSFVWTHLTNLLETSSPYKQALREILEDEKLEKEFNMDRRKYSRNYEASFFSDTFGLGAGAESNVIWSSKSFLPRSAMLNLTVDMLGHSVNLLEVGGRVQGLETLMHEYFGSNGIFKGGEKPKEGTPSRCVKQQKMDNMKKKFATDKDELTASMYVRMFGNELGFHHFDEKELMSFADKFTVKDILATMAKGQDISFTQSTMFMDSSISVPTISGMALTLSVNGTAAVELVANAKMDLRKFSLKKMEAMFEVRPSGAVQLSGMMSVDAGAARSGLKMVTTLHTSTSASGSLDLTNGQVLTMDLDTPKRNMDILDVKSEFFLVHDQVEKKQEMMSDQRVSKVSCSPETVLKVLGYELCGAVSFINATTNQNAPYFPFTGPMTASITVHKKDAPKGFKLVGKSIQNKATSIAQLSFDTPGSVVERAINIGYFIDRQAKSAEAELSSPWKKLMAKGSYTDDPTSRVLSATVLCDGREHKMVARVDKNDQKGKTIWSPSLELSRPKDSEVFASTLEKLVVGGTIEIDDKLTEMAADISINTGLKIDPIEVKANFINNDKQHTLSGSVTLNKKDIYSTTFQLLKKITGKKLISGKLEPTVLISAPSWRPFLLSGTIFFREEKMLKGNAQITMEKTLSQPIEIDFKLTKQSKKGMDRYRGQSKFTSQFAMVKTRGFLNAPTDSKQARGPLMTTKVAVDYSIPILKNKALRKNKVLLSSKIHDRSSASLKKYDINVNLDSRNFPAANVIANLELSHKDSFTKSSLSLRTGEKAKFVKDKTRELKIEMSVNHKIDEDDADIRYGMQVMYPQQDIEYEIKGKHEHHLKNKFSFETYAAFIYGKGKTIEFRLLGNDNTRKGNLDASGSLELSFPAFEINGRKYDRRSYLIGTSITKNVDKEYIHTINLQVNDDAKHSLVTKFKKGRDEAFDLFSQLQINGDYPARMTVTLAHEDDSVQGSVSAIIDQETYSAELKSRFREHVYKSSWDLLWPERRVRGSLEAGQMNQPKGVPHFEPFWNFETSWDADRDPSQKIESQMHYLYNEGQKDKKMDFLVSVSTPFKDHKVYGYKRLVEWNPKEVKDEFAFTWGTLENELSYSTRLLLPVSLEKFEMNMKIVTPWKPLRLCSFDVMHKFDGSHYLSSTVKGAYNDDHMEVVLMVANTGDMVRNDLDTSVTISSSLPKYQNILLKLQHNDDGRVYSTVGIYERNGKQYKATLGVTYFKIHYQIQCDCKLEIELPLDRPITMKFVHANTLTNINSTISLNWKPEYDTKLIVGGKYNKAEKDYALDVTFSGPWKEFKEYEFQYRHNAMGDITGSYFLRINKDPNLTTRSSYRYTDTEITYDSSSYYSTETLKVHFARYPYTLLYEASYKTEQDKSWKENKLVLDGSVNKIYPEGWRANAKLVTPWEPVQNIDVQGSLQKTSKSEWALNSLVSMGVRKQISSDFSIDIENWTKMSGRIETPFKEMKSMSLGMSREQTGESYSSEGYLEVLPYFQKVKMEQTMSLKPDLVARYYLELPETEIKFLEVNIDNTEHRRGYNTNLKVNYHPDKEIDLKFKGRYNQNKFPENTKMNLDLSTPFEVLPSLNFKVDVDKEKEKWVGEVDLKSGAKELEYLNVKFEQEGTDTSCHSDFEIASSVFETVAAGMHFDWGDNAGANLTLNAPSVGRSMIGFKKRSQSWTDFQNKVFAEFNGYEMDMDVGLKHDEQMTKAWLTYAYPGADHSYIQTSIHRLGNSANDFDVGGFLQVGKDSRPYNVSLQYSFVSEKMAIGTTLETPYTKSLSYLLRSERRPGEETSTVYGKYGRRYLIDSKTSAKYSEGKFDYSSQNEYLYDGKSMRTGATIAAHWSAESKEATIYSYYDDKWVKVEMDKKTEFSDRQGQNGKESLDILVFTPFKDFTDIGMHSTVNFQPERYEGSCSVEYMDEKEAVLTFDMSLPNQNRISLDATLTTPVENYRKNTLTYQQTSRRDHFIANAEVITGKGEHLNGKFDFKNKEEYMLTLQGPMEKFESLTISGKYNEREQRVSGDASLLLSLNPRPVNLEYDIHITAQPVTLSFKLKSPYDNFRRKDLTIEHEGQDWKQFKTTAVYSCEKIGTVTSETTWRFTSVKNMEGMTKLTSTVKNMENLKLGFSAKEKDDKQMAHLEVGWHINKDITLDTSWSFNESGKKTMFSTDLDIVTPFPELKMGSMKLSHTHGPEMFIEGISLHHNSKTYLDADLSYEFGNRHEGNLEIKSPRPMSFFITGSASKQMFDGLVKLNWDKRSPEAHIELLSSFADKSDLPNIDKEFKFKAIHPVRTMGVDVMYKKANSEILSTGQVTWDEQNGNTFSYDLGYLNRTTVYTRMYEGHLKLGVPQRSVKFQGSCSASGTSLTTNTAVFWDADKDDKKKVTMSTTVETRENFKRVGLNINLPYINKQLNLGATTKAGYRSTLADSRAEISYSSDPRKMIIVTSVMKNLEYGSNENYNYTTDITFEHQITDTNIQISSHLAKVDKVCSVGGQFNFLTASRQRKTLAFWGKVDRAQRNMEVKVITPIKTIGIEGQLDDTRSQHHMLVKSFEDDKQALKLDIVVDQRRRNMDVEFNYDQDDPNKMVKLSGHFSNDSALQVDLTSQDGRQITSESMVAVRLNTSRILHTRILWRPTLFSEMQTFMGTKVTAFSYAANEAFTSGVDSVGSEVKAKYVLVSQELRSEMSQVFQLMEKEMDSLSVQLEALRTEFRRFYQRNDLHIKDMGDQVKAAFDNLFEEIRDLVRNYRSYYTGITKATNDWLTHLKTYPIASKYATAIEELVSGLKSLREVLEEALNEVAVQLEQFSEVSYKQYLEISRTIDRKLNSYTRSLYELPLYHKMMEQRQKMGESVPEWTKLYDEMFLKGQKVVQDQFHDMMSRPEFQHIHAVASEVHQQVMYWNLEQSMNMAVRRVIELSKSLMLLELAKLKSSLLDLENSRVIVYDPERGELQFEIHLPIPMKSLVEGPEVKLDKYLNHIQKMTQFDMPSVTNSSVWDAYYEYVPSLEPSAWGPPFEASGYLIGGQHYFTFDKMHYDFLSTCSHVLARDMQNDNFSVVVNYERKARKDGVNSICFTIEDSLTFEISADYKLEVNSRETEMPFITDKVKVIRDGDVIHMQYIGGLEVICNPKLDFYKVTVSGWYHGHVAGLLGGFDNEHIDDKMIEERSTDFEVNRRSCNSRNMAANPDPTVDLENKCYKAFEPATSKFRPCFKQVDPNIFVHMCQLYMSTISEDDAIYMVTEQYRHMCQDRGVYIGPLKDYIPCNSEDPFIVEGTDPIYQSADVLFVVEDNVCNQWATNSLATLVTEVNNALTSAGMKDNRFGLESYGGADTDDVSVRTMNGQQFGEASLFLKALETLRFSSNNGPVNPAKAINEAMEYPYRPGVAKVLVIAPCSSCEVGFLERSFAHQLNAKGFTVHVLQEQEYEYPEASNSARSYKIYGMDNTQTFPSLSTNEVEVQGVQGKKLADYCVTLAQATNGSVFDTAHLGARTHVQQEFIQSFAQRVGWDTKLPPCQTCQCSAQSGRVECELCNTKSLYSYVPWNRPSLAEALGSLHDFNHDVKTYFGLVK